MSTLFLIKISLWRLVMLSLLLVLVPFWSSGQSREELKFDYLTLEDGLSQTTVFCILQDRNGFIWFGTEDGLNKYDGYSFRIYSYYPFDEQSLSNNTILALYEDKNGMIWIGTNGGGLNIYDRVSDSFIHFKNSVDSNNSIVGDMVYEIYEDRSGTIWLGTSGGVSKAQFGKEHDYSTLSFANYTNEPGDPNSLSFNLVRVIFEDRDGNMWIGTQGGGLNMLEAANKNTNTDITFKHFKFDAENPNSISEDDVLSIYQDDDGLLWLGTYGGGLNILDIPSGKIERYLHDEADPRSISHDIVLTFYEDRSKNIWIGTYGGGLNKAIKPTGDQKRYAFVNYQHNLLTEHSISNNSVGCIFEDKFGVLWVGTYGGALNKFDTKSKKFTLFRHNPQNENSLSRGGVGTMFEAKDGILWVGTSGGGLNRIDRSTGQIKHYIYSDNDPNGLPHRSVSVIFEDSKENLWVGTNGGGLCIFNRNSETFTTYQNDPDDDKSLSHNVIRAIVEDANGVIWIGTHGGGLNKFDPATETFLSYRSNRENEFSLSQDRVRALLVDSDGDLWVGNDVLSKLDRETEKFTHYQNDPNDVNSLSDNNVRSIYQDDKGILWIGTLRGGLNKLNKKTGKITHWRIKDGLPNDVVYGVLGQGYNIWMSTNKGISHYNVTENKFKNYDISDGLQSNEFSSGSYHQSSSGEMFFGGINGFNAFYPDSIQINPVIPEIIITGFQIFNKEVQISDDGSTSLKKAITETDSITLSYEDYIFSFEFAALHYSNPGKNEYAYKMVDINEEIDDNASRSLQRGWQYVGTRRFATFTNMEPGEYIFSVKGSNSDGLWNEEGRSIYIRIVPPFWRTQWFYLLWIIAGLAGVWLMMKVREKYLHIKINKLESEVETLVEMLDEEKKKNSGDWNVE